MVVGNGCAGFLDGIQNGGMVPLEFRRVIHLGNENEVQVGSLRVAVGHMGGDNGIGQGVANFPDIPVNLRHVGPVDAALQCIGDNAEIH